MAMAATTTTPPSMTSAESEHVILAPASAVNPIPCLPAALRLDNQQQLERLLLQHPADGNNCNNRSTRISTSSVFRQVLVFGTESLRTLLLRQVLNDPHRQKQQNKKKNWDNYNQFNFPKSLQHNILSTRLLQLPSTSSTTTTTTTTIIGGEGAEVLILEEDSHEQVDVITYFLRPWDLSQTQAVHARIRAYKKRKVHHRIVYLPQPTALVSQLIQDLGLTAASNVSIEALQLDLFPIESDVLSLEYDHALRELTVEGTPSNLIQTCSRSLLKLQDIVGTIPRIQSIGKLGEEVLQKLLNQTVDEYLANDNETQELQQQTAKPLPDNPFALLLIDRNVDMVTPMVTPLTYEGLLDDVVGIDCG